MKVGVNSWGCFIEDIDDYGPQVTRKRREGRIFILDDNMVKYTMHVKGQNSMFGIQTWDKYYKLMQIRGAFSWAKAKNYIELKRQESKKIRKIKSKGFCRINKKAKIYRSLTLNQNGSCKRMPSLYIVYHVLCMVAISDHAFVPFDNHAQLGFFSYYYKMLKYMSEFSKLSNIKLWFYANRMSPI